MKDSLAISVSVTIPLDHLSVVGPRPTWSRTANNTSLVPWSLLSHLVRLSAVLKERVHGLVQTINVIVTQNIIQEGEIGAVLKEGVLGLVHTIKNAFVTQHSVLQEGEIAIKIDLFHGVLRNKISGLLHERELWNVD